jgi:hypothetical protein
MELFLCMVKHQQVKLTQFLDPHRSILLQTLKNI